MKSRKEEKSKSLKISQFFAPTSKRKLDPSEDMDETGGSAKRVKIEDERDFVIVLPNVMNDVQEGKLKNLKIENFPSNSIDTKQKPSKYAKYIKTDESGSNFECKLCGKKLKTSSSIRRHIGIQHMKTVQLFECDFCGKTAKRKDGMITHMLVHLPKVTCHICQAELKQRSIDEHLRSVHATEKKFNCKICLKSFTSKLYLSKHEQTHDKKFECSECDKKFPSISLLDRHKQKEHDKARSFECEICHKKFNYKNHLKNHQKTHDGFRPKPFKCQKCSYSTDNNYNFKVHQKSHQRHEEKFAAMKDVLKCEKCHKFCKSEKALNQHMMCSHPLKQFHCDLCGRYIKTIYYLKSHMEVHLSKKQA